MEDNEVIIFENEGEGLTSDSTDGGDDYARIQDVGDEFAFDADEVSACDSRAEIDVSEGENQREEYDRLIRTRFKDFFAEDTQRLINKRFKKYKALEEKVKRLEDEARKYTDIESLLIAERERAVSETEERMNRQFKAMRMRAVENATSPRVAQRSLDVSKLTKSQRASLASRALKGEKIKL